jgi:hypothetical protein
MKDHVHGDFVGLRKLRDVSGGERSSFCGAEKEKSVEQSFFIVDRKAGGQRGRATEEDQRKRGELQAQAEVDSHMTSMLLRKMGFVRLCGAKIVRFVLECFFASNS